MALTWMAITMVPPASPTLERIVLNADFRPQALRQAIANHRTRFIALAKDGGPLLNACGDASRL